LHSLERLYTKVGKNTVFVEEIATNPSAGVHFPVWPIYLGVLSSHFSLHSSTGLVAGKRG